MTRPEEVSNLNETLNFVIGESGISQYSQRLYFCGSISHYSLGN